MILVYIFVEFFLNCKIFHCANMIVWALYIPAGKAITNSFSSWFSSRKAKLVVATSKPQVVHKKNYLKSLLLLSTMYYEAEISQKKIDAQLRRI